MEMDRWLCRALFPECPRVGGIKMAPFCARHLAALRAQGNLVICGGQGAEPGIEDVVRATLICSSTAEEQLRKNMVRAVPWRLRRSALRPSFITEFAKYFSEMGPPLYTPPAEPGKGGNTVSSDWLVLMISVVAAVIGEESAWWSPLGYVLAVYQAVMEAGGRAGARISSDAERSALEDLGWKL